MKNVCKHIYALIRVSIANTKNIYWKPFILFRSFSLRFYFYTSLCREQEVSKISFFDDSILNIHFR